MQNPTKTDMRLAFEVMDTFCPGMHPSIRRQFMGKLLDAIFEQRIGDRAGDQHATLVVGLRKVPIGSGHWEVADGTTALVHTLGHAGHGAQVAAAEKDVRALPGVQWPVAIKIKDRHLRELQRNRLLAEAREELRRGVEA